MDFTKTNEILAELSQKAIEELNGEGFENSDIELQASLDLRYARQAYEINIPLLNVSVTESSLSEAVKTFHETHEKIYGFNRQSEDLELINIRLIGIGKIKELQKASQKIGLKNNVEPINERLVHFHESFIQTPIYQRTDLHSGVTIMGPAVIEQLDSTIVIYPKQMAFTDENGNLIIKLSNNEAKEEELYEYSAN